MVDDAPLLGFRIGVFLDRNHVALLEGSSHERPEHWTIDRLQRRKRPVQPAINAGALLGIIGVNRRSLAVSEDEIAHDRIGSQSTKSRSTRVGTRPFGFIAR